MSLEEFLADSSRVGSLRDPRTNPGAVRVDGVQGQQLVSARSSSGIA